MNAADPGKDKDGSASSCLAADLRFLAVAGYVLRHDVASFRTGLGEAASLAESLLDRFDRGLPVSSSYVSMTSYKSLLDALAAHDHSAARRIAEKLGNRPVVEAEHDHPFDRAFGYTLKFVVLDRTDDGREAIHSLLDLCGREEDAFRGYAEACAGLLEGNLSRLEGGLGAALKFHKRLTGPGGPFRDTEDEVLGVWAIGLASLAVARGLVVSIDSPLMPAELLR